MKLRLTTLVQITTACALLAGVLTGCNPGGRGKGEWVEREVGFKRAVAKTNPFLAAERFVEEMGNQVESWNGITKLPPTSTTIIVASEAVPARSTANRLLEWSEEGGHLVYLVEGGDSFVNDFSSRITFEDLLSEAEDFDKKLKVDRHPILSELGIDLRKRNNGTISIPWFEGSMGVTIPGGKGVEIPEWLMDSSASLTAGKRKRRSFASFPHYDGRISILADAQPLRNRYLQNDDHAEFLWKLLTLENPESIWFVRGTRTSLLELLWEWGWMPLLSLFVLIIFWLWKSVQRFGPEKAPPPEVTRDFSEHIAQSGKFLWAKHCGHLLLEPVRRRILRKHQTNSLQHAQPEPSAIAPVLASRTGLTVDRVTRAFQEPPGDSNHLVQLMQDLQNLDSKS